METLRVGPLPFRPACSLLPGSRPVDLLRAYSVFGGVPRVLVSLDRDVTVGEGRVSGGQVRRKRACAREARLRGALLPRHAKCRNSPKNLPLFQILTRSKSEQESCVSPESLSNRIGKTQGNPPFSGTMRTLRTLPTIIGVRARAWGIYQ